MSRRRRRKQDLGRTVFEFITARPNLTRNEQARLWCANGLVVIREGRDLTEVELQAILQEYRSARRSAQPTF